jgi:glycosyltransferase involved in cell wall biosynthesis
MLVSIIIPVYKSQEYIEACAKSLFQQTYTDLEYIFIDDAGGDDSMAILEKVMQDFPERHKQVKILHHDTNRGSAMARETGMMAANGDYIIHVDSDDTVAPHFIERLAKAVIESDADVAVCGIATSNQGRMNYTISQELCDEPFKYLASVLGGTSHSSLCNKLFKSSILKDNDLHFNENINMYDDKSVVFRALYYCKKIAVVNEVLYYYNRNNRNSITHKTRKRTEVVSAIALAKLVDKFFADKPLNENITLGIVQLKNAIAGMLLNHVSISDYRNELKFLEPFKMGVFMHQANLPLHYKSALLLYNCKLYPLIWLQRKLVVRMSNQYYKSQNN